MWLALWLIGAARAENMGTESLDWMTADSEVVVRATVTSSTPNVFVGDAWEMETVTVRVLEVVSGPAQPESLTWTWRTRSTTALKERIGGQVLLFLTRGDDGVLAPRSWMLGYVDLGHPDAMTASTATCEVLDTGQEVLAYVREAATHPHAPGATSHWSTWSWWREGSTWHDCEPGTETYHALWAGSAVGVLVPSKLLPDIGASPVDGKQSAQ